VITVLMTVSLLVITAWRSDECWSSRNPAEGNGYQNLPLDERIDARILSDGIDLELLYLNDIKEWNGSPGCMIRFHIMILGNITRILTFLTGFAHLSKDCGMFLPR
jgi:hypothetical protein